MKRPAFTLIELLIVVAIIAILAAIAVPNFLEAQTRSKVTRAKADFRTIATGMEAYAVDNNRYPTGTLGDQFVLLSAISTPVAYLTSAEFLDVFTPRDPQIGNPRGSFLYYNYQAPGMYNQGPASTGSLIVQAIQAWQRPDRAPKAWLVTGLGPDRAYDAMVLAPILSVLNQPDAIPNVYYDATNGTISGGDLGRFGGSVPSNMMLPQ